jgi:hypothetical protein
LFFLPFSGPNHHIDTSRQKRHHPY